MPSDPAPELQPCQRFEWERIVRRIAMPPARKLIACLLAQYGDVAGRRIRPGIPRLAATSGMGERTVERRLGELRDMGLIVRTANGGGPSKRAAEYRLTVPSDALTRFVLLDPDEGTPATQQAAVTDPTPVDNPETPATQQAAVTDPTPVDNPETPATQQAAVIDPAEPELPPPGTELPPKTARTPATQVANHQGITQRTPKTSPEVSTSPVDPQPRRSRRARADPDTTLGRPPPGWRKRRRPTPDPDPTTREAS